MSHLSQSTFVTTMSPSRKRAAPAQSSTLLDFFNGDNAKSHILPCKKTKSDTEIVQKKPKMRRESGTTRIDAIVIDDGDDSADNIIADFARAPFSPRNMVLEPLTFGKPILLSSSPPPTCDEANDPKHVVDGSEGKVIENDCLKEFVEVDKPDEDSERKVIKEDAMGLDEWGMGDDEMFEDNAEVDEEGDDDQVTLVEDSGTPLGTCERACPLCGMSIIGLSGAVSIFF